MTDVQGSSTYASGLIRQASNTPTPIAWFDPEYGYTPGTWSSKVGTYQFEFDGGAHDSEPLPDYINSVPALVFDPFGASILHGYIMSPTIMLSTEHTMIMVCTNEYVDTFYDPYVYLYDIGDIGTFTFGAIGSSQAGNSAVTLTSLEYFSSPGPIVITFRSNATQCAVNFETMFGPEEYTVADASAKTLYLASLDGLGGTKIGEILIYDRYLTDSQAAAQTARLIAKYS